MISTSANTQTNPPIGLITFFRQKAVYSFRLSMFFLLRFVYYFLYEYGILSKPPPPITISSLSESYVERHKLLFSKSFENVELDYSKNIEKCFYDTTSHALAIENVDNELEKTWRRRIMLENTPRGNIIMYYDAYKQGFAYYSDQSTIPYFVLNAAVMKYVLLYKCRDFFIDDQMTPENMASPLLDVVHHKSENPALKIQNESTANITEPPVLKSSAFAKLKSYNTVSGKLISNDTRKKSREHTTSSSTAPIDSSDKSTQVSDEKKYTRNKIIYMGKISNFTLLQPATVHKRVLFSSDLLAGLDTNSGIPQNRTFNYKEFKLLQSQKQQS